MTIYKLLMMIGDCCWTRYIVIQCQLEEGARKLRKIE